MLGKKRARKIYGVFRPPFSRFGSKHFRAEEDERRVASRVNNPHVLSRRKSPPWSKWSFSSELARDGDQLWPEVVNVIYKSCVPEGVSALSFFLSVNREIPRRDDTRLRETAEEKSSTKKSRILENTQNCGEVNGPNLTANCVL